MKDLSVICLSFRAQRKWSRSADHLESPLLAPTLILTGRQDWVVGYRNALSLLENFSRGTLAVLDRSGHALCTEQEGLFHALTSEWLDRVEEWIRQREDTF